MNNSLYNDLLGFSYSDNMKVKPNENYDMQNNYSDPLNNIMTDDGIYSMGMSPAPMMMNFDSPSPVGLSGYQEAVPMLGYNNVVEPASDNNMGMALQVPNFQDMPPDLADMVNSLLLDGQEGLPFNDFDQADLDVNIAAAASQWDGNEEDDDPFSSHYGACGLAPPNYEDSIHLLNSPSPNSFSGEAHSTPQQQQQQQQRSRKVRKTKTQANAAIAEFVADSVSPVPPPHMAMGYDPAYPNPADFGGVCSPASSSSGYSDTCSLTGGDDFTKKPRQRRPRVSYSTLTEEEKYKRIRDLNNEASRIYREKQRDVLTGLEHQLPSLVEKNRHLKNRAAALEKLRDQMKQFSNSFLQKHMSDDG